MKDRTRARGQGLDFWHFSRSRVITLNLPEVICEWDNQGHPWWCTRYTRLAAVWQSTNLGKSGIKDSLWNSNLKRFVATFCRESCKRADFLAFAFRSTELCVRVCVTGWRWRAPASTVSHLLDKSLICVTQQQQGIMGVLGRRKKRHLKLNFGA